MVQWFYKATPARVPFAETRRLAVRDGFICRSAYIARGHARVANTQGVKFGHLIHFYFSEAGRGQIIGSFEVVGPNRHAHPEWFGKGVKGTALFEVTDDFAMKLGGLGAGAGAPGYRPDPVLKQFTGWALVQRDEIATPPFESVEFPFKATLVKRK